MKIYVIAFFFKNWILFGLIIGLLLLIVIMSFFKKEKDYKYRQNSNNFDLSKIDIIASKIGFLFVLIILIICCIMYFLSN